MSKMTISEILGALWNNELVMCDLINPHDTTDTCAVYLEHEQCGLRGKLNVLEAKTGIMLFDLDLDEATQPLKFTYIANSGNYAHRPRA